MNKFYPPNSELRSSWLSLAEGCRGQAAPCGTLQIRIRKRMRNKIPLSAIRKKQNRMKQAKFRGKRLQVCTTYYGVQRTQADSEANLPDGSEKVSLRNPKIHFYRTHVKTESGFRQKYKLINA